ncbi:MAG TPA: phosphatidylglycerol lysyltransferase domain-containing protein [Acidimicrobiales bacterium]|nr:phosphatidylglycerol lysyltransferase domain-containing protein [Acidimicrobiales bacterium]
MLDSETLTISVGVGRRVVVVANFGLGPQATATTTWAVSGFGRALDTWEGPGLVVVAGNLFDLEAATPDTPAAERVGAALAAHPRLAEALRTFAGGPERRVVCLPGTTDAALSSDPEVRAPLEALGVEVAQSVDLEMASVAGPRRVRIAADVPAVDVVPRPSSTTAAVLLAAAQNPSEPWQEGIDRLADPASVQRFLTSRLLYRRFARFSWWLLVPFAVALVLSLPFVADGLTHLFVNQPRTVRAIARVRHASWGTRLLVAGVVCVVEVVVMAGVLGWLARHAWRTLGGGRLDKLFEESWSRAGATANDAGRDAGRALGTEGYAALVTGATLQAELTHLTPGVFACSGAAGDIVEEHPGRLGMLPVFLPCRQLSWVELETGADLHVRLLMARAEIAPATLLERVAARDQHVHEQHPVVVAAYPRGASWPPGPDLDAVRRRSRRVRRWASGAIAFAGVVDLLSAVTPPLRGRLHFVLNVLPLGATQAAGALVALAGIGLLALARGVRRGQYQAWAISSVVLGLTLVLHLARGGDLEESLLAAGVLLLLLVNRNEFRAASDRPSLRSAGVALLAGVVGITVITSVVVELTLNFDLDRHRLSLWRCGQAVVERLVGIRTIALPDRLDDFLAPSLLTVGVGLAVVAVLLATRPVVDRRRSAGRAAETRARDIVKRHGEGTLDYFALRSDKQWFFHRDSLVAYAIYGGVCLVSPDTIGPQAEREQVWGAFRRFADNRGWVVAVMGGSEDWLPIYRATGMHEIYIGDEAVVDLEKFSLAGGHMKGLRQAYNRIAKYGYTATFHDPSRLDRATAVRLTGLMSQSRRGEFERGFSMMLGRIFDPRDEGLVLCVVTAPDGAPAALCQFVPARGIGGFSLDLMRRDRGEHPNGLIDFALVSSIEHFRAGGHTGLSLNFAALRSILEGEGDGVTQRVERWALKKMSSFLQIETLWRFNAKYEPQWLPRYVVYDTAEHLVPVVLAILRAESLSEVPVIGRMIAASDRRAHAGLDADADAGSGASLLPGPDECEPSPDASADASADASPDVSADASADASADVSADASPDAAPVLGSAVGPERH